MKRTFWSWMAAVGLLLAATGVRAEEIALAPKFEPFSDADVTLVSHCGDACAATCGDAGMCCGDACGSCCSSRHVGRDFLVCRDRCGGIVGGFETLMLKPYVNGGYLDGAQAPFGGLGFPPPDGAPQLNYNPAFRTYIGWQNADGLGARVRYFAFDQGDSSVILGGPAAGASAFIGVESRTFDVELTQAVDFRRWNLQFAGGLRYGEFQVNGGLEGVPFAEFGSGFYGTGATFATQATRDLNRSGSLRFSASGRWSGLAGNTSFLAPNFGPPFIPTITHYDNSIVNVFEISVGPQYRRRLRNGAYLTAAVAYETQTWVDAVVDPFGAVNFSAGFGGFSSSIAITR